MFLMMAMIFYDYIKIHDKYVGFSNNGSDDESGLVKDGVKYVFQTFFRCSLYNLSAS